MKHKIINTLIVFTVSNLALLIAYFSGVSMWSATWWVLVVVHALLATAVTSSIWRS